MKVGFGIGAAAGLAWVCLAAGAAAEDFPTSLSCSFTAGTAGGYEGGLFNSKPPHPLSFSIEAIDLEKQTAELAAEGGGPAGKKVTVVRAINANHFLEAVNEGFLNLTTVYDKDAATGKYPAVHSRHFGLLGQPVFGQYTGFCTSK